jgi:hypothetical protein
MKIQSLTPLFSEQKKGEGYNGKRSAKLFQGIRKSNPEDGAGHPGRGKEFSGAG